MILKKKIGFVFLTLLILIAGLAINTVSTLKNGEEILSELTFNNINLASIEDGTYTGDFEAGLVYASVSSTIKDGILTDIKLLEHKNGKGSAAESILSDMLTKQTTSVDAISGATISSKVIRKAVENSLSSS